MQATSTAASVFRTRVMVPPGQVARFYSKRRWDGAAPEQAPAYTIPGCCRLRRDDASGMIFSAPQANDSNNAGISEWLHGESSHLFFRTGQENAMIRNRIVPPLVVALGLVAAP